MVLWGGKLMPALAPVYLGLRANALGTYDDNKGYVLDSRYERSLGYNMKSLTAYSVVLGWQLTDNVTVRTEYTLQDIDLVTGAEAAVPGISRLADDAHYYGLEVAVTF